MKRTIVLLAALIAATALVVVPTVFAGTMTQVQGAVSGTGHVTGTLTGDMYFDFEYPYEFWGGGQQVVIVGREYFVGSVDGVEEPGWLHLEYRIETRWDAETGALIPNGRCQHRVIGSGDGLAGTTGYIHMKDRWGDGGGVETTYSGHLNLPGASEPANALARSADRLTALASATQATCGG